LRNATITSERCRAYTDWRRCGGSALLRIGGTAEAAVATWVLLGLVDEAGIFLIAFGGEADVVELNFIGAGLCDELGEKRCCNPELWGSTSRSRPACRFRATAVWFSSTAPPVQDVQLPCARRGRWRCGRWRACFRSAGSARTSAGREYRPDACRAGGARREC